MAGRHKGFIYSPSLEYPAACRSEAKIPLSGDAVSFIIDGRFLNIK
jgi:hypothetical protein